MITMSIGEHCCTLQPLEGATRNIYLTSRNTLCTSHAAGSLKALANMVLERNTPCNRNATHDVLTRRLIQRTIADYTTFEAHTAIIEANGIPREWAEGYAMLCRMSCPSTYALDRWRQLVDDGGLFLDRWGRNAAQLGWKAIDVFGVHAAASTHRYDSQGLVTLLAGRDVIAITADIARIDCGDGAHLTFHRTTMAADAVALWHLK